MSQPQPPKLVDISTSGEHNINQLKKGKSGRLQADAIQFMSIMKKNVPILNVILILCGLVSTICYDQFGGLWLKGVTSAWFVLIGLVNFIYACKHPDLDHKYPMGMMAGLLLCFIADIVLNITFIPGALIFAIGHIFYFVAYCGLIKFRKSDLLPSVIIFIGSASLVLFVPIFDFGSALMQGIILLYALIISLMVGKAISNMRRSIAAQTPVSQTSGTDGASAKASLTKLIVVGSALFFFSDLMLLLCYFAGAPQITDTLCLFTYYPGQYLLAHTLYRYVDQ